MLRSSRYLCLPLQSPSSQRIPDREDRSLSTTKFANTLVAILGIEVVKLTVYLYCLMKMVCIFIYIYHCQQVLFGEVMYRTGQCSQRYELAV